MRNEFFEVREEWRKTKNISNGMSDLSKIDSDLPVHSFPEAPPSPVPPEPSLPTEYVPASSIHGDGSQGLHPADHDLPVHSVPEAPPSPAPPEPSLPTEDVPAASIPEGIAESIRQTADSVTDLTEKGARDDQLTCLIDIYSWIDSIDRSLKDLADAARKMEKNAGKLRASQDPLEVYKRFLLPLVSWMQDWQGISRQLPDNAGEIAERLDETALLIEKNCLMYGAVRYRSSPGDLFDADRMIVNAEDVETSDDPSCQGTVIESLGDGWLLNGRTILEEKVRAYSYNAPENQ